MLINPSEYYPEFRGLLHDGVPDELRSYPQWVCWRLLENKDPGKKPRKMPCSPMSGRVSGHTEKYRSSWGLFSQACDRLFAVPENTAGVGFVVTDSDPFVVIDFDNCVKNGVIDPWVVTWIDALDSYTELSPSGTGIHIIVRGKKPGPGCKKKGPGYEIEMYETLRFITITGHLVKGKGQINQNQDALAALYKERIDVDNKPAPAAAVNVQAQPLDLNDEEILNVIRRSKQSDKFFSLMSGSKLAYANHENDGSSEADLAFCTMLAFWFAKDTIRMDRVFRQSGLMRAKWDSKRGEKTYGQITMEKAVAGCKEVYAPSRQRPPADNVVPINQSAADEQQRKKQSRAVQTVDTGFDSRDPIFTKPYPWPDLGFGHFVNPKNGALYRGQPGDDDRDMIALRPIWIHSEAKDEYGETYRVIKFYDSDFQQKTACYPAQWFGKLKDVNVWNSLLSQGMIMLSGKEKHVSRFLDIQTSVCPVRSWAASRLGWFEAESSEGNPTKPVFVLPDTVLGETGDDKDVFFQSMDQGAGKTISSKGSMAEWKKNVAEPVCGNHLLAFPIMVALCGGMNGIAGLPSGGFHFWGLSSKGKTTILQCAASVWGCGSDPQSNSRRTSIRKWNATANGLEATAQLHNDIVLCLDEIDELEPADLHRLVYTLTGGTPKSRGQKEGGLKDQNYWRIMLVSSGETSSEAVINSTGKVKKGGQVHRLPDIRIDGAEGGVITVGGDLAGRAELVDRIKKGCSESYGTAGPVFITWMLNQIMQKGRAEFVREINDNIKAMESRLIHGVDPLPNEIHRVLKRMATVAVAGLYAAEAGVLDWTPVQIDECVQYVRAQWLNDMEDQVSEVDRALADLRGKILTNLANFEQLIQNSYNHHVPVNSLGFRDSGWIMIYPKALESLSSYGKRQLLEALDKKGLLSKGEWTTDSKGVRRQRVAKKIPKTGMRTAMPRCYWIDEKFLEE